LLLSVFFLLSWVINAIAQEEAKTPVLVELFTSEGCSTCPPADALLSKLKLLQPFASAEIIPIEFHVDYWNHKGWADQFSSPQYTRRQEAYSRLKDHGPYTPQMVVDGLEGVVGSEVSRVYSAISRAAALPKPAKIRPTLQGSRLSVEVESSNEIRADVMLAIVEDNLEMKIAGGENGGKVLQHNAVVRELKKIGSVKKRHWSGEVELRFGRRWKQPDLQVIVFLQEHSTGHIIGVVSIPLSSSITGARSSSITGNPSMSASSSHLLR
jgi:hypothetical protein